MVDLVEFHCLKICIRFRNIFIPNAHMWRNKKEKYARISITFDVIQWANDKIHVMNKFIETNLFIHIIQILLAKFVQTQFS